MTRRAARSRGSSALEWLLALPVVLLVGLGVVQGGLLYQARLALRYAAHEAARSGSLAHADAAAIRAGLAGGLAPWLYGADSLGVHLRNKAQARLHIAQGEALGWVWIEQLAPHAQSFQDWGVPARDDRGQPIPGTLEIPHDMLAARIRRTTPRSGLAAPRGQEPVGRASQQTLRDANVLQLRIHYGVPLVVPVVGRVMAWSVRAWHGCQDPGVRRFGLTDLGARRRWVAPEWRRCLMMGPDPDPDSGTPRLPITVQTSVTMQSPARQAH